MDTYIQKQPYSISLPTEGGFMQRCAGLRLPVYIYPSLDQQPVEHKHTTVLDTSSISSETGGINRASLLLP